MRCFACNTDAIPTTDDMDGGYYFCGGEPVCVCDDATPPPSVEFEESFQYPSAYLEMMTR